MQKTHTFNRPVTLMIYLPVCILLGFLIFGFYREQNFFVLIMVVISLLVLIPGLYMSFLRRLKITEKDFTWITPGRRYVIGMNELRHYGVVKYRRFKFIYVSKAAEQPFIQENSYVVSDPETFVIQYRHKAWRLLHKLVQEAHPALKPGALEKQ